MLVACDCGFGCVSSVLVLVGSGCWFWSVELVVFSELVCLAVIVGMVVLVWFVVGCVLLWLWIWLPWFKSALCGSWCCCLRC